MDLTSLTPEQIAYLRTQLDAMTPDGLRGPNQFRPRQLHDLRKQPSATDARPLFVWSADQPYNFDPTAKPPFR